MVGRGAPAAGGVGSHDGRVTTRVPTGGGVAVGVTLALLLVQAGGSLLFGVLHGTHVLGALNDDRFADAADARLGAGLMLGGAVAWLVGCTGAHGLWRQRGWLALGAAGAAVGSLAAGVVLVPDPWPQPGHWPGVPAGMAVSLAFAHTWSSLLLGAAGALVTTSRTRPPATGPAALVTVTVVVALGGLVRPAVLDSPLTAIATAGFLAAVATTSFLLCQGLAHRTGPRFARFRTSLVAVLTAGAGLALLRALVHLAYPTGGAHLITTEGLGDGVRAGLFEPTSIPLTVGALLSLIHPTGSIRGAPEPAEGRR
jgi:hypothetical protein